MNKSTVLEMVQVLEAATRELTALDLDLRVYLDVENASDDELRWLYNEVSVVCGSRLSIVEEMMRRGLDLC